MDIESFEKNIGGMRENKLQAHFNIGSELLDIVTEIIETGKSSHLAEFMDHDDVLVKKV